MAILSGHDITKELEKLQGWKLRGSGIERRFELRDFAEAMGFAVSVGLTAEKANHHPDIDIRWNVVTLFLSTHSEGGLTAKDFHLAARIDELR